MDVFSDQNLITHQGERRKSEMSQKFQTWETRKVIINKVGAIGYSNRFGRKMKHWILDMEYQSSDASRYWEDWAQWEITHLHCRSARRPRFDF